MSIEAKLYTTLSPLFGGRVFPDFAPTGTAKPYCTYQQVGGKPVNFMGAESSDKKNARIQINVWAETRLSAQSLIRQIEDLAVQAPLLGSIESGAVATFDEANQVRGARQDFSFWG